MDEESKRERENVVIYINYSELTPSATVASIF